MVAPLFRRKGLPLHKFPAVLDSPQAIPFVPPEFPLIGPARQRGVIETSVSLLLTTLAVVTAVQNVVIRDPLYSVAGRAKSAPEWQIPPNLLTTTLVPVAAATPTVPDEIPLVRRIVNVPQFDPPNTLAALVAIPSGTSFPAPYITPIQGVRRQVPGFDPPNVTIALPTGTAAPFKPYDWTSPGRARSVSDWSIGQNIVLVNAKPFIPVDWSVTRVRQQTPQFEAPNLALTLPTTPHPFIPIDWTVAGTTAPAAKQVGSFEPPNALITTLSLAPPVAPDTYAVRRSPHRRAVR